MGRQRSRENNMLHVTQMSIELIELLRPLVARIKQRDRSLADQITRAASSIALNLGEGEHSEAGNRRARFLTAAGSAGETMVAIQVAVAWRYIEEKQGEPAKALLRRILAILWKLTRG